MDLNKFSINNSLTVFSQHIIIDKKIKRRIIALKIRLKIYNSKILFEAIRRNYRHWSNRSIALYISMTIPDPDIPVPLAKMTRPMAINSWFLREILRIGEREWTTLVVNSSVWNSETDNRQSRPKTDAARVQYSRDAQTAGLTRA